MAAKKRGWLKEGPRPNKKEKGCGLEKNMPKSQKRERRERKRDKERTSRKSFLLPSTFFASPQGSGERERDREEVEGKKG